MDEQPITDPTPSHLTILLKHGRSTTVLSVLSDTSLRTMKSHLLQVLSARNVQTLPGTIVPLPDDPDDLELGILIDRHEPHKGWVYAEDRASIDTATGSKSGGKKKSKGTIETVGDLELKDGAWIAYRRATVSDDDEDDEGLRADPGWNVDIPSFDEDEAEGMDAYGRGESAELDDDQEGGDEDEDMDIPIPTPRNAVAR